MNNEEFEIILSSEIIEEMPKVENKIEWTQTRNQLKKELEELQKENEGLNFDITILKGHNDYLLKNNGYPNELKKEIEELKEENEKRKRENANLRNENAELKNENEDLMRKNKLSEILLEIKNKLKIENKELKELKNKELKEELIIFLYCKGTNTFYGFFKDMGEAIKYKNQKYEETINNLLNKIQNDINDIIVDEDFMINKNNERQQVENKINDIKYIKKSLEQQKKLNEHSLRVEYPSEYHNLVSMYTYSLYAWQGGDKMEINLF